MRPTLDVLKGHAHKIAGSQFKLIYLGAFQEDTSREVLANLLKLMCDTFRSLKIDVSHTFEFF